jgi:phage head maturation protease
MYDMFGEYEEVVRSGAGAKTLSEKDPTSSCVFNHEGLPMARTKAGNLELSEDDGGLHMRASNLNGNQSVRPRRGRRRSRTACSTRCRSPSA